MMTIIAAFIVWFSQVIVQNEVIVTFDGQQVASAQKSDFTVPLLEEQIIDTRNYTQFIKRINEKIYQKPLNATINDQGSIVPGKVGIQLHQEKFKEQFYRHFFENSTTQIEAPVVEIHPKVDTELLANIRTHKIGQYVTYFNQNKKARAHNISLAGEAINNHVVFPGETFSFNEVVGKRTKEKGYLPAPEIVKGELTEGIGGGICQISSTLFNAVDRAGVKILERYSHSKRVPYVPPGRDATVSWYGPDFTFKNSLNQPLLIQSKTQNGQVIIEIYSSDIVENRNE
ncbi:VanW family protein [Gracilibacillus dipsosauri]|uniref:Uncharacterized protein n=1 Tax=Gracilibacillus dipsosauri TaxID=178340 RepID=A0A317KX11_9BACI|nr:VanW family protein [Gracilibacillus dipsosauri]PWU68005.1 hypothetical protein DLJ74_12965 [Gracilibacillus dipsosauri]